MENLFYLIYVNSNFIEGICLTKNSNNFSIVNDIVNFDEKNKDNKDNKTSVENNNWINNLEHFLDLQKWRDHPIAFLLFDSKNIYQSILSNYLIYEF